MNGRLAGILAAVIALACGGCSSARLSALPANEQAYTVIPVVAQDEAEAQRVRAGDLLSVRVFGEPELSSDQYRVDAAGYFQMPLVGELIAAGQSPNELRAEITRRLAARFIRDPQVSVAVSEAVKTKFTVEGQVAQPGVFDATSGSTLLSAIAQAQSPTKVARLDEVLVFRTVDGKRMGARFNLADVRSGQAPDPQILPGDTIVVGFSAAKGAFRDFLQVAPLFSLFTIF